MKYELNPYNRNIPDEDCLNDVKRVALELGKDSLSQREYNKHGKFHSSTISRRFKSWTNTLELAGIQIRKFSVLDEKELLEDLQRVSGILKKNSVTQSDYNSIGKYSSGPFKRVFGSWFNALKKAGLEKTRNYGVTDEDYFENIEEVWAKLGRQPNYAEMQKPFSRYSASAYEKKYGSWRRALESFIKFVNDDVRENEEEEIIAKDRDVCPVAENTEDNAIKHKTKRNISWRLGWIIKQRDNFTCKSCGRSPALIPGTILHVDHIKPYSKGGETVPENLQTLCMECNIGKSNLEL